jgi:AcrR family transcriptional regulator
MGRPPRITRQQILEAARAAFADRGFASTTLADIAAPIGVTPAAILRHFSSKQDLFAAAMSERGIAIPEFLDEIAAADASADPRVVLRRFAEQFVPFVAAVIRPAIAVQMHMAARQTTVVVPFDTEDEETPPRRGLRVLSEYFQRAMNAGVVRRGDPRALALLFAGQLQSYVFIHFVLNITPVFPLDKYVDALLDLWSEGAIVPILGGTRARKTLDSQEARSTARDRRSGRSGTAVLARAEKTEAADSRGNDRGPDGQRRVARRRPRRPRSHR